MGYGVRFIGSWPVQPFTHLVPSAFPALVIYEYFITFGDEVKLFWAQPKITGAAALFFANRYATLSGVVYLFAIWFMPSDASDGKVGIQSYFFAFLYSYIFSIRCECYRD